MKKLAYIILTGIISGIPSCKDPDSIYKEYIVPNGLTYPAKALDAEAHPGRDRIEISWRNRSDPAVKKARIFWNNYTDSVEVAINQGAEYVARMIDPIDENTYSFMIHTYDADGNVSMPVEVISTVYGNMYESSLVNRTLSSCMYDGQDVILEWYGADKTEAGVNLTYTDINGNTVDYFIDRTQTETLFTDCDIDRPIFYSTAYMPDSMAIDIFHAPKIERMVDTETFISMDSWTGTASSQHSSGSYTPAHAIDGNMDRWWHTDVSAVYPHWIAFDMKRSIRVKQVILAVANAPRTFKDFMIQGSMNGVAWTDYPPADGSQYYYMKPVTGEKQTFTLAGVPEMQHIRIWCVNSHEQPYATLANLEVFGSFVKK